MKLARAGDRALLADLGDVSAPELHGAAARLRSLPGVLAAIAGHSSVLVVFAGAPDDVAVQRALGSSGPDASRAGVAAPLREIPVRFGGACGPDLDELLERAGRDAFFSRVGRLELTVRYLGFRGGFGYLDGWPAEWAMERRPTSRSHVPRGTFGVAAAVAGFYPIDSPGGWNLLGRTDQDLEHALRPGDRLVLRPDDSLTFPGPVRSRSGRSAASPYFEVVSGPLTRWTGPADWSGVIRGIPAGGPFDDVAAALANRAVGAEAGAPLLECAIAGPRVRLLRDAVLAWCGPDLQVRVTRGVAGEERSFGRIEGGLRGYLAAGHREGVVARIARGPRNVIEALAGPHGGGAGEAECEVTPQIDRVGIRLRPLQPPPFRAPADLPSAGMQCGTVQLHPDGSLIVMGPDHPVTGGYLQPMTVRSAERWKLAQLVPGERVTLRWKE